MTVILAAELANLYPSRAEKTELTHAWSGLLCFTDDGRAIVGAIKEYPGQYMSLGYMGHGMVSCFTSGRHVVELIVGKEPTLPGMVLYSPDRF